MTYPDSTRPSDVHVVVFELSDGAEPSTRSLSGLFDDHDAALARWRERWGASTIANTQGQPRPGE